jgi:hypothetical protein
MTIIIVQSLGYTDSKQFFSDVTTQTADSQFGQLGRSIAHRARADRVGKSFGHVAVPLLNWDGKSSAILHKQANWLRSGDVRWSGVDRKPLVEAKYDAFDPQRTLDIWPHLPGGLRIIGRTDWTGRLGVRLLHNSLEQKLKFRVVLTWWQRELGRVPDAQILFP